jgi:hypothetical protein
MQQDDEDRKNEIVVKGFEDKIKKLLQQDDEDRKKKTLCYIQPKDHLPKLRLKMRN